MLCIAALVLAVPAAALPQQRAHSRARQAPPVAERGAGRGARRAMPRGTARPQASPERDDPRKRYVDEPLQELCAKLDLTPATQRRIEALLQQNMRVASVRTTPPPPAAPPNAPIENGRVENGRAAEKGPRQARTPMGSPRPQPAQVQLRGVGALPGSVVRDIEAILPPEKHAEFLAMLSHQQWNELRQIDQRTAAVQQQQRQAAAKRRGSLPAVGPSPSLTRTTKSPKSSNWSTKWTAQRNVGRGGRGGGRGGRGGRGGGRGGWR